jgi:F0F1-type ATP synthase alpha subunit
LNQPHSNPVNMIAQIILLYGGLTGLFSDINIDWIPTFERKVIYLINSEDIFTILNVVGRDEMPEEIMSFFINMLKAYLSNEESIY